MHFRFCHSASHPGAFSFDGGDVQSGAVSSRFTRFYHPPLGRRNRLRHHGKSIMRQSDTLSDPGTLIPRHYFWHLACTKAHLCS